MSITEPKPNGFTLVELTIALSILCLLYLVAAPVAIQMVQKQQTKRFVETMSSDLNLAMSEAVSRHMTTEISVNRSKGYYTAGFLGAPPYTKVDLPPNHRIKSNFASDKIRYYSNGQVSQAGTIYVTDPEGRQIRIIVQLSSGRFYVSYE